MSENMGLGLGTSFLREYLDLGFVIPTLRGCVFGVMLFCMSVCQCSKSETDTF